MLFGEVGMQIARVAGLFDFVAAVDGAVGVQHKHNTAMLKLAERFSALCGFGHAAPFKKLPHIAASPLHWCPLMLVAHCGDVAVMLLMLLVVVVVVAVFCCCLLLSVVVVV